MHSNNLLLILFTIVLLSGCSQTVWVSKNFDTIKSEIDTLAIILPHVKYFEKIGETENVKRGHCIFVSINVANILAEIINDGKFLSQTVAVQIDSNLIHNWIPRYYLDSIEKYDNLNNSIHLHQNGGNTFPITTELKLLLDEIDTKYLLFVHGHAFGTSIETMEFDILQAQTHAILYDQAFSYDYQWNGLKLHLYIIDKNSGEIVWYRANSNGDNKYNPLRNDEIKDLCLNLLEK